MNERIKELVEQAKDHADYYAMLSDGIEQEIFTTKFAELIVKECVDIVEGGRFLHDEAPTAIFARECSSAIKRHFGVSHFGVAEREQ